MLADIEGRVISVDAQTSERGNEYANLVLLQQGEKRKIVVEAFAMKSDVGSYPTEGQTVIMHADVTVDRRGNLQVAARDFVDAQTGEPLSGSTSAAAA